MQVKTDAPVPLQPRNQHEKKIASEGSASAARAADAAPGNIGGTRPNPTGSGLELSDQTRTELRALQRVQVQSNRDLERFGSARGQLPSMIERFDEMSSVARLATSVSASSEERAELTDRYRALAEAADAIHSEVRYLPSGLMRFGAPDYDAQVAAGSGSAAFLPDPRTIDSLLRTAGDFRLDSTSAGDRAERFAVNLLDQVSALASAYELAERRLEEQIALTEAAIANVEPAATTLESFEEADRSAQLMRDQILELRARSWVGQANISTERALALLEE